jgi:hypothetical protein
MSEPSQICSHLDQIELTGLPEPIEAARSA